MHAKEALQAALNGGEIDLEVGRNQFMARALHHLSAHAALQLLVASSIGTNAGTAQILTPRAMTTSTLEPPHLDPTPTQRTFIVHEVDEAVSITVSVARSSAVRAKRALIIFQSCLINNFSTFIVPTDNIRGPIEHTGHGRRFLLHAQCFFCPLRCSSLLLSALLRRHSTQLAEEPFAV